MQYEIIIGAGKGGSIDWFTVIQTIGIVAGLLFSSYAIWRDSLSRKTQNYLLLTQYHRDVWRMTMDLDGLERVNQKSLPDSEIILTEKERRFLTFALLHMTCAFELSKTNNLINVEKDKYDIGETLHFPLFKKFWDESEKYYNADFRKFIVDAIKLFEASSSNTKISNPQIEPNENKAEDVDLQPAAAPVLAGGTKLQSNRQKSKRSGKSQL